MTPISPEYTRGDLIAMIHQRDALVSGLKEVCTTRAARIEALEAALAMIVLSSKDSASVEIARAALDPTAQIDWDILAEERLEQRARAALAPERDK